MEAEVWFQAHTWRVGAEELWLASVSMQSKDTPMLSLGRCALHGDAAGSKREKPCPSDSQSVILSCGKHHTCAIRITRQARVWLHAGISSFSKNKQELALCTIVYGFSTCLYTDENNIQNNVITLGERAGHKTIYLGICWKFHLILLYNQIGLVSEATVFCRKLAFTAFIDS